MKIIIGCFLLISSLFAGTVYKTPAFEVKDSKLYCAAKKEGNFTLVSYAVGDIVDGDYVVDNCSKNRTTIENMIVVKEEKQLKANQENVKVGEILGISSIVLGLFLFLILMFAVDAARGNKFKKIPNKLGKTSICLSYIIVILTLGTSLFLGILYPIILGVLISFGISKAIQKISVFGYDSETYYKWAF